jgi:hypothetical protein
LDRELVAEGGARRDISKPRKAVRRLRACDRHTKEQTQREQWDMTT